MFRFLVILFVLFHFHGLQAQNDTLNQKYRIDKGQEYLILYGSDRPSSGYPSDVKIEEGPMINARKEGLWTKYWEDGFTPKLKGHYKNNRPSGEFWKYYRNGKMKELGSFERGRYYGPLIKYDSSGNLRFECRYNEIGRMIDTAFMYLENGCLEAIDIMDSEGTYLKTILFQEDSCNQIVETIEPRRAKISSSDFIYAKKADSLDTILMINPNFKGTGSWRYLEDYLEDYSDSSLCSDAKFIRTFNRQDEIIFNGTCKEGKVWDGKMYFYDSDMIILQIEIWKDGQYLKVGRL